MHFTEKNVSVSVTATAHRDTVQKHPPLVFCRVFCRYNSLSFSQEMRATTYRKKIIHIISKIDA